VPHLYLILKFCKKTAFNIVTEKYENIIAEQICTLWGKHK